MLLRLGIIMMAAALLMAGAAVFFIFLQREEPVAVAETAAKETGEPTVLYGEPEEIAASEEPVQQVKAEAVAQSPEPKQQSVMTEQAPEPEPVQTRRPEPEEARSEPAPSQGPGLDWPAPTPEQVQAAGGPRHYDLTAGAVMGLTVEAIGLYNVPVFDSSESWALDSGVRHVPETSMPWSGGAQRNVYLEGHRLGYPGTGSHLVFYNLDKLSTGDEVLLRRRDGARYRYRVIDAFVVNPADSWVMGRIRGRDLLTLQTCTGPNYTKRLIVRAERV